MSEDVNIPVESWRGPQRRGRQVDAQMVRMGFIAGVVGLVALAAGGYALVGRRPHVVPVVEADSHPIRVRPDNPGGATVEGADEQIMGGNGKPKVNGMAPPSEVPAPQALRAQIQAGRPSPAAAAAVAKIDLPDMQESSTATLDERPAAPERPVVSSPSASRPGAAPAVASGPKGAATSAEPATLKPPVALATPETSATAARPATTALAASHAPAGTMQVQLGALESEQAATTEWKRLEKRMPALLGDRQPAALRAEHDGKPIWRLRTGGFADTASATAFCTQVRAKGVGCAIASF